jgi:hypothetical protein
MPIYSLPRRQFGAQKDEPTQINWRRGMFRIWLLLSAAWINNGVDHLFAHIQYSGRVQNYWRLPRYTGPAIRPADCPFDFRFRGGMGIPRIQDGR